jgi:hypothetical protein
MKDQQFIVPLSLLNQIAQYLSTRPYADVVSMMAALQSKDLVRPLEMPDFEPPPGRDNTK